MKAVLRLFMLLLFLPLGVAAQKQVKESALIQVFENLRNTRGCVCEEVKYTGSDIHKAGGFVWQRGNGTGWTVGQRLTLDRVKPSTVKRIRKVFESFKPFQFVNLNSENQAATYMENTHTVYVYDYVDSIGRLYFLKATTEGEISVPRKWKEVLVLDATAESVWQSDPFAQASQSDRRLLGLSRLWAGVKQNFVFMDRFRKNWDSIYVATIPQVLAAQDDEECTRIFQKMVAQLGDGHTYVWGVTHYKESIPLRTRYLDGKVYVDAVQGEDLQKSGIRRGMELLSINGEPVLEYGEKYVRPYVASSTPQWTRHQVYESGALFTCREGDTLLLELKDGKRTLQVPAYAQPYIQQYQPTLELKMLKGKVAYLRIRNFMAQDFTKTFNELYPDILKSRALIIDIRDNGGGNSGNGDYILRHLTRDTIRTASWSTPMYLPAYVSWGYPPQWYNVPSGKMIPFRERTIYEKPIVLLVNAGTFSAAEDFCSVFRGMKRGKVLGVPTGGSTGNGVRLELIPGKSYVNICSKHDLGADGTEFVGTGIRPDQEVSETYRSWFEDKYDAGITTALKLLSE